MSAIGTRNDPSKVLLGCPRLGPETVAAYPFSALVSAGVAGCLNSSGQFVKGAANPLIGISRGVSMDHADRNSVTLRGKEVPLVLTDVGAYASLDHSVLVFTAKAKGAAGNDISIALTNEATAGSESVEVTGMDIVVEIEAGASTATQVKAAIDASAEALELIGVTIDGSASTAITALTADNLEGGANAFDYVVPGAAVFVDATTGFATKSGGGVVESNWKYASDPLTGVYPSGSATEDCALVVM